MGDVQLLSYRKDKANDALAELAEWDFVPRVHRFLAALRVEFFETF